jgi:4-nitrophenyl phosphatase
MSEPQVAAVLLAAGGSTRFGEPKQLLKWEGRPLVAHVADVAWAAGLRPVVVVVGAEAERVAGALEGRPVQVLRNYRWETGVSTSVSLGLAPLSSAVDAAIFLQVDQPLVSPTLLQELVAKWRSGESDVVVPTAEGQRGSPVLVARALFDEWATLSGDVGGRALFDRYAHRLAELPVEEPDLLSDVDTPEAFQRLRERVREREPEGLLADAGAVICDMDGVLWRGEAPLPGFQDFFRLLDERDLAYTLVTNNSTRTPEDYVAKLARHGAEVGAGHILTSALAAADYLVEEAEPGALVYAVGAKGLREALLQRGFRLSEGEEADYVVMGWDQELTWEKMARATLLVRGGAAFVGTNPDITFPHEEGIVPGTGAQLKMLEVSSDVEPVVAGKPEPVLYRQAMERMGATAEDTLVVGDRLETDILGGTRLGLPTVMLLSGVQGAEDVRRSPIHPDLVFENLAALVEAWRQAPRQI